MSTANQTSLVTAVGCAVGNGEPKEILAVSANKKNRVTARHCFSDCAGEVRKLTTVENQFRNNADDHSCPEVTIQRPCSGILSLFHWSADCTSVNTEAPKKSRVMRQVSQINYQLLDPQVIEHPYPFYRALLRDAPVYQIPGTDVYLVSSWHLIHEVLKNQTDYSANLTRFNRASIVAPRSLPRDTLPVSLVLYWQPSLAPCHAWPV